MDAPLSHWLRLLWGRAPPLQLDSAAPFIAGGALHLPAQRHWLQHRAAAAHAAAHLVYSPTRFDGTGLVPLARALLALLEDARVEALAGRELPGLARLWRPLHTATPDDGTGCEALLRRLARSLADPGYDDAHPWVRKGCALFYLDGGSRLLALHTPAELRSAACRLGHDLGQMRLPFNVKTYRPAPDYRDDHRWMWDADALAEAEPPPLTADAGKDSGSMAAPTPDAAAPGTRHPEWDRLIARLRPDWCTVVEPPLPATPSVPLQADDRTVRLTQSLHGALRALARPAGARRRRHDGEVFDVDALLHWCIARRLRVPADARVYRGRPPTAARVAVWMLVDQSASTAAPFGTEGATVLQAAAISAAALARALQALGIACAVGAFSSNGRHAVRLRTLKRLDARCDDTLDARLQALRSGGSTRLGAVLRHVTLAFGRGGARWVLLLSDGQPHDVDLHDARYLVEDARHAVRDATRHAVRMACVALAPGAEADARRIFGRARVGVVDRLDALPRTLQRLMA